MILSVITKLKKDSILSIIQFYTNNFQRTYLLQV